MQPPSRRHPGAMNRCVPSMTARRGYSSKSKATWLRRVQADTHGNSAKRAGFRSRAAAKLLQLDERFSLLRPGISVLELGAAPGSWTQVATRALATRGSHHSVVAVDLHSMDPVAGASVIKADATSAEGWRAICGLLPRHDDGSLRCDLVLSDMAPKASGIRQQDHERSLELCSLALRIGRGCLSEGGALVTKLFQGGSEDRLLRWARRYARLNRSSIAFL